MSATGIEVRLEVNSGSGVFMHRLLAIEVPGCGLRLEAPGYAAGVGPRIVLFADAPAFALGHNSRRVTHVGYDKRTGPPSMDTVRLERHHLRTLLRYAHSWRFDVRSYARITGWIDLLRNAGIEGDGQGALL